MIDWNNHDGVNFSMINDFMRNQFYEKIIKNNVKNKTVLDIGFGTGLLSIIALKHGAKKIIAFENDPERYQLGLEIIKECNLSDKIDLHNQRYNWQMFDTLDVDAIVTETVSGDLWNEGLWNSFPRHGGIPFLPNKYFLEIHIVEIPKIFAESMQSLKTSTKFFTPGIDIDQHFVHTVNKKISANTKNNIKQLQISEILKGLHIIDNNIEGTHGYVPFLRMVADGQHFVSKIELDAYTCTVNDNQIDFDQRYLQTKIDNLDPELYYVVVPRVGLQHETHKLYLDTGHWGPTNYAGIVHGLYSFNVAHDVHKGKIHYTP